MSADQLKIIVNELDISNPYRGPWLVKVPKYIAKKWEQATSDIDVGTLRICKTPGRKEKVSLSLTNDVLAINPAEKIPTKYELNVTNITQQTLDVFSETMPAAPEQELSSNESNKDNNNNVGNDNPKVNLEGRLMQKFDCRPIADDFYMKLKTDAIRKAAEPKRRTQKITNLVQNLKPVNDHAHNIDYRQRKKVEGKNVRKDKDYVIEMLFKAFEQHQYYNLKDLVQITKQPIKYLKEILNEFCDFNMQSPHKFMWQLKKEYRHYETEAKQNEEDQPAAFVSE